MANANSNQTVINFGDPMLNCSEYKDDVKNFNGFNYRNSPFLSGEVKPLYRKDFGAKSWVDYDLNEYKVDEHGVFTKNNTTKAVLQSNCFLDEINLNDIQGTFIDYCPELGYAIYYYNGFVYIKNILTSATVHTMQINGEVIKGFIRAAKNDYNEIWYVVVIVYRDQNDNYNVLYQGYNGNISVYSTINNYSNYYMLYDISVIYYAITDARLFLIIVPVIIKDGIYKTEVTDELLTCIDFFFNTVHKITQISTNTTSGSQSIIVNPIIAFDRYFMYAGGAYIDRNVTYNKTNINFSVFNRLRYPSSDQDPDQNWRLQYNLVSNPPQIKPDDFENYSLTDQTNVSIYYEKSFVAIVLGKFTNDTKDVYLSMIISRNTDENAYLVEYGNLINNQKIPPLRIDCKHGTSILYNNETVVNISINNSNDNETRGSVLIPYYTADEIYPLISDTQITFDDYDLKDTYVGAIRKTYKLYIIRKITGVNIHTGYSNFSFNVMNDRYLIFNTADFYNCYDIKEDCFLHFADDYNNRIGKYDVVNSLSYQSVGNAMQRGWIATAVNAFFEANKSVSISSQFNPVCTLFRLKNYKNTQYISVSKCNIEPKPDTVYCDVKYYGVDLFWNSDITNSIPEYKMTLMSRPDYITFLYNFGFEDDYTIEEANQLLAAPLLAKFYQYDILNYMEMGDFVKAPILRIGTFDYPIYYLLSSQEDFDIFFVIQTAAFGIKDGYVYSLVFENGILTNITRVASCKGLEFIASTPLNALFWAKQNQTLYSFKGNCLFEQGQTLDEVSSVIQAKYNPETTEVFLCTDKYVLVSAVNYTYKIPIVCTDIFFSKYGFVLRYTENSQSKLSVFTYNEDFWTDQTVTRVPIEIETSYYGIGNNSLTVIDCVYLRIYNNLKPIGTQHPEYTTYLEISADCICADHTIKHDNGRIWSGQPSSTQDNLLVFDEHNTAYIRWQPKIQNVVGMKINIETNCCITFMAVGSSYQGKEITKY